MPEAKLGIIGGTGLGQALCEGRAGQAVEVETPFGKPSGPIQVTQWGSQEVAFLSRHGPGHLLNPSRVPYRANIYALKTLGVTHVIASGATGSLQEHIKPGDLVIIDQVIDKTAHRSSTFFDGDLAVHAEFAQPFCGALRRALLDSRDTVSTTVHDGGVYICMEGPQFSSAAESHMHRSWGGTLIGMTCLPEAKLAREAEMCYAVVALPTDYDCWRPHAAGQDQQALLEEIIHNLEVATQHAITLIRSAVKRLSGALQTNCPCQHALRLAIWSDRRQLDPSRLVHLKPLLQRYIRFDDAEE